MSHPAPESLQELTDGFLSRAEARRVGSGLSVQASYHLARFRPELFEELGIARPESLARSIDKRLAEFLAGRILAQFAQRALGFAANDVAIGAERAPVWPLGMSGSISHARGRCACLLVPSTGLNPGIDIEAIATGQALESILRMAVTPQEAALLRSSPDLPLAATLCFSAKEALFKALYPTVRRHFGFPSARLSALPENGTLPLILTETLHPTLPAGACFDLCFDATESHVLTWMLHRSASACTPGVG